MKKLLSLIAVAGLLLSFTFANVAEAKTRVRGYYKPSTGRYVAPHYRSSPDSYKSNNWSSRGSYNPFTGKKGYSKW